MREALSRHRPADGTERRLAALRATGLLGAPAEERFDRLTRLARHVLQVPVALVSLLDAERQFFLSAQGLSEPWASLRQTPLAYSFCRSVVEAGLPLAVANAREDPHMRNNPAVEELGVVAYIAVPLALPDGCIIGALCGIDHRPRAWTATEEMALRDLAGAVQAEVAAGLRQHEAEATSAALRASEARYRALFEVSPQMVWFTDARGHCTYVNQYYTDFVGLPAEQVMGEGWLAVVHAKDRASVRAAWTGAMVSETNYEIEFRLRRGSDGSYRWFSVRGAPQRAPDGRVEHWIGVGIDINDRRCAEDALRRRSRKLELLSEAAGSLLAIRDPDEVLQPLFRSLSEEFGIDVSFSFVVDEAGNGLRLASCFGVPEEAKAGLTRLAFGQAVCGTVAQTRRTMCLANVQASDDPKVRLIKSHGVHAYACFPLLAAGDRLLGTLSFGTRGRDRLSERDLVFLSTIAKYVAVVRERLDAEVALRASEARLRELQAELLHVSRLSAAGEMVSALAHELHQPLTAATSALEAVRLMLAASSPQDPGAPMEAQEAIDLAAEQALRAGQIVRRLRDFIAHGETEKRLEHLPKLVEEASALATVGAREHGVAVAFHFDPRLPPVLVDRIQIQQVLFNLIRNAFEAMDGEVPVRGGQAMPCRELVVSAVLTSPADVEVAVADTGPGLPPEVAGRLFEPFVSTKPGGMGVGLSISRTIIEAHGGQLWAEPNPGGGTVFRFTLPAAP